MAKNRIAELKEQEFQRQMEEMLFEHQRQREDCEQAHIKQYQEFRTHWDNELKIREEADQAQIHELDQHHIRVLQENREEVQKKLSTTFKASSELLNLRKIQAQFAKQKDYKEAHEVQTRANEMEQKERERWEVDCHKKVLSSETALMAKLNNDMNALKKRLEAQMNESLKMREQEQTKILQRYQNVKREIENQ